jgi:hypothetical protein
MSRRSKNPGIGRAWIIRSGARGVLESSAGPRFEHLMLKWSARARFYRLSPIQTSGITYWSNRIREFLLENLSSTHNLTETNVEWTSHRHVLKTSRVNKHWYCLVGRQNDRCCHVECDKWEWQGWRWWSRVEKALVGEAVFLLQSWRQTTKTSFKVLNGRE